MKRFFYIVFALAIFTALQASAQETIALNSIFDSIRANNPSLKMYDAEIRSLDEAAKGARSWMAPELSTGFFMVPYAPRYWKAMDGQPGMGQYTISAQQTIPNPKRLNADFTYMSSMSSVEKEKKGYTLNQLYAEAKKSYYRWIIIKKQQRVLDDNEKLLNYMIQSAALRYKNGLDKINAYYKAKAALADVQSTKIMLANEIKQSRYTLNTLMFRNKTIDFDIDTLYQLKDYKYLSFDTTSFLSSRSDLKALENEMKLNTLKQETERARLLPEFGVRFENAYGWARQPMQFTAMAMVRLPMTRWSARMNKANIESLNWKNESLKQQKQMILNESIGMAYGMRTDILNKLKQLKLYQENILPALRRNFQTYQLAYEQNSEELFELFDSWETLNKTEQEYLNELQEVLLMQVELERVLQT
ncbi:TolC family protein [Arcticibacter tournemirensis]|uniref:TolC family protein n=1 Tax=Arcticibacter tournemirensis TaxID=699437 RepID=A0A5M9GTX2_9SPHI|nr:TolC family protein [Arcticibacter tournemirensis]KAA8476254.1 TolC family protein [Arcticibacter tournemirensis]